MSFSTRFLKIGIKERMGEGANVRGSHGGVHTDIKITSKLLLPTSLRFLQSELYTPVEALNSSLKFIAPHSFL